MSRIRTPQLGRRDVVTGLAALTAFSLAPGPHAAAKAPLVTTPAQTEGPFYPTDWGGDADNDLVRVTGAAARAQGEITHVIGRVLDTSGSPIAGAAVEIWQCDANGIYRHPADWRLVHGRDDGFQGRGRARSGKDGAYSFRTIRPVTYPGRTPHIHFAIVAPGHAPLITQMYVAGEPLNQRDGILNRIRDPRQRDSVIVKLQPGDRIEDQALVGTFDIVLGT
jgi:protocatechuate 3,4-dioxygenase, beta subunit